MPTLARAARALAAGWACACAGAVAAPASDAPELSVLTVPRLARFESADPQRGFDDTVDQLVRELYSTLLTYSYLERPFQLAPDLLEAMPTTSADGLTYTFRLRAGVRFVDNACFPGGKGRVLTSDDVLYSIKRYADANVNVKSWFALAGAIVGLDDYHAATLQAGPGVDLTRREVAGLHRIDDTTFTIRLTHPNALFLHALAMAPTAIVPVEAVAFYKDRLALNPVGTGPFMATRPLERQGTIRLVRNPGYYRTYPRTGAPGDAGKGLLKDAGKRLPLVDVLELPLIEEAQPAALKFLRGELDWRPLDRASFTKLVVREADGTFRLAAAYARRFEIYGVPSTELDYLMLNQRDSVLGPNKALRQAIASAIDSKAVVDVLWNGRGRPLHGIVPWDLPGSERETGATGWPHDVAAGRRLMAEAGYPGGKGLAPVTISFFQTNAATHDEFDLLKSQLATIGVRAQAAFMDQPTFAKALENGNFQIASYGWVADYPDAEDFYQLAYGRNVPPGNNWMGFRNAAYDRAYEASRGLPNGPARYAYFRTMNALLRDEVPVIPVFDPLRFGITQAWVGNFKRNLMLHEDMFLSVDMAAKRKRP